MTARISIKQAARMGIATHKASKLNAMKSKTPFEAACIAAGLQEPVAEFCFAPPRKWRFDWAWPERRIALETQGGIFSGGRHVRGDALLKEYEKLNEAACNGWRVLFVTPQQMASGEVFALLKRAMP